MCVQAMQTPLLVFFSNRVGLQVQLDGSVKYSGAGYPPFAKLVSDLPPLDDIRTRFMDGIGPADE
jgi:hypothetical protein